MTDAEKLARGESAKRILADPLVIEALATIESEVVETMLSCPQRDDEGMRRLQSIAIQARKFKGILQGCIEAGKLVSSDLKERESLMKQVVSRFR